MIVFVAETGGLPSSIWQCLRKYIKLAPATPTASHTAVGAHMDQRILHSSDLDKRQACASLGVAVEWIVPDVKCVVCHFRSSLIWEA